MMELVSEGEGRKWAHKSWVQELYNSTQPPLMFLLC